MPLQVNDVETLQEYISGVMGRADHHAGGVNEIALALVGAIIWRKDTDPIQVMAHKGHTKNVLWAKINGNKYTFSYNHNTDEVEMRKGSTQGNVFYTFSNATPLSHVKRVFASL